MMVAHQLRQVTTVLPRRFGLGTSSLRLAVGSISQGHVRREGNTMGFLDSFERQVENLVGGAFAKTFTSGVHPLEIISAVKKELDSHASIVSRARTLAPHSFRVVLSPVDYQRLQQLGADFVHELRDALSAYGTERGYVFADHVSLTLEEEPRLSEGMVDIRSVPVGPVVWIPAVIWKDVRYPITRTSTTIGRGTDSDVHVVAPGVSRHHAEIRWNGKRAEIVDLNSTNGTKLDGVTVERAALPESCTLGVGQARILFQVVALPQAAYEALAGINRAHTEETHE